MLEVFSVCLGEDLDIVQKNVHALVNMDHRIGSPQVEALLVH
jgi:hypothetical protein